MRSTTRPDPDRLYTLLPALYRIADEEQHLALKSLLGLINQEADALRAGTQQLWDDAFIETCQRWVVPYIGDLVGNIPLHDLDLSAAAKTAESLFSDLVGHGNLAPPPAIRTRADVARTIYYRRRKGTPVMLEELARDVTGWGARVVEFFALLDWNQHLEHLRLDAHGCPSLRRLDVGDRAGGAWDSTSHTVDVRHINQYDGWHNIKNIGFFLWRLEPFPLVKVTPRAIGGGQWRFTFSPLGHDTALFASGRGGHVPVPAPMATELDMAAPMRAVAFLDDLRAATPVHYGDPLGGVANVVVLADDVPVPAGQIDSVNLGNWAPAQPAGSRIGIDVVRGRMIVGAARAAQKIEVSYFYGFSGPMGGGHYDRSRWLVPHPPAPLVTGGGNNLQAAINGRSTTQTVITIDDDATYDISGNLTLRPGESLTIQAADQRRPHLKIRQANGAWQILTSTAGAGASLTLNGLLVEGGLAVNGDLATLRVLHTTLVPGRSVEVNAAGTPVAAPAPSVVVATATGTPAAVINTALQIQIAFSITGALRVPASVNHLWLLDSIVDGRGLGTAISGAKATDDGPSSHLERTTIFGTSRFSKLPLASESIFTGVVTVEERQQGCVRFSFVPALSRTPQQYLCQPQREIARRIDEQKAVAAQQQATLSQAAKDAIAADVTGWLVPSFTTTQYGAAAYAQLHLRCPSQIRTGAADGAEMGAFNMLKQPHREANLRMRLDEYLPVGLEAGVIYVT